MTAPKQLVSAAARRTAHVSAVADTLLACMIEDHDPRRVRLDAVKASAFVGELIASSRRTTQQVPSANRSGYYVLHELIQYMQAVHPGVFDDAVCEAGKVAWRAFEARCRARRRARA